MLALARANGTCSPPGTPWAGWYTGDGIGMYSVQVEFEHKRATRRYTVLL